MSTPLSRAEIYAAVDREPAFVSVIRTSDGAIRRRVHLGIGPARAAVTRARQRGDAAECVIVQLEHLAVVGGEG